MQNAAFKGWFQLLQDNFALVDRTMNSALCQKILKENKVSLQWCERLTAVVANAWLELLLPSMAQPIIRVRRQWLFHRGRGRFGWLLFIVITQDWNMYVWNMLRKMTGQANRQYDSKPAARNIQGWDKVGLHLFLEWNEVWPKNKRSCSVGFLSSFHTHVLPFSRVQKLVDYCSHVAIFETGWHLQESPYMSKLQKKPVTCRHIW